MRYLFPLLVIGLQACGGKAMEWTIRIDTPPEEKSVRKEGVALHTYGCGRSFSVANGVRHMDCFFLLTNERSKPVTYRSRGAMVKIGSREEDGEIRTEIRLGPGESREIYQRFYIHAEYLRGVKDVRVRLGEIEVAPKKVVALDVKANVLEAKVREPDTYEWRDP